jgi:hypothetical protein
LATFDGAIDLPPACADPKGQDAAAADAPLSGDLVLEDQHSDRYGGSLVVEGAAVA